MSTELVERLIASGTPVSLAMEVAAEFGRLRGLAEAADRPDAAAEKRRAWDRDYRAQKRAAERSAKEMSGGSGGSRVDTADKVDAAPAPDKSLPQTPSKINPTPGVGGAPACEADLGSLPDGEEISPEAQVSGSFDAKPCAEELDAEAARVAAERETERIRKRWKDMPPPPGVSEEIWASFVAYRRSMRKTLTFGAYRPLVTKLAAYVDDAEWPPGRIIEEIMDRGWLTFKPEWLRERTDRHNGQRPRQGGNTNGRRFRDPLLQSDYEAGRIDPPMG
jgi:hypothetical protein